LFIVGNHFASARTLAPKGASTGNAVFMMLVSPADALHGRDSLFRNVLNIYHPLAVAAVLCRKDTFQAFARRVLLDLRSPLEPICPSDAPAAAQATEAWFRQRLLEAALRCTTQAGLSVGDLNVVPTPETASCVSYCPRCEGQYERDGGACNTCEGVMLVRFGEPVPSFQEPAPLPPPVVVEPPATTDARPAVEATAAAPQRAATTSPRSKRDRKRRRK
jgi:hypothetical protein